MLFLLIRDPPVPVAVLTDEEFPPEDCDRHGFWARLLLGRTNPETVTRSVLRRRGDGAPAIMLRYFPPVFQEAMRIYGPDGALVGRAVGYFKTTLRAGFQLEDAERRPFGTLPFAAGNTPRRTLLAPGGREMGTISIAESEAESQAPPERYFVEGAPGPGPFERFMLLAAAITLALADRRHRR
jgi:hypothetical protein